MNLYNDHDIPGLDDRRGAVARILGFALGAWLVISAFAWPHTAEQRANTCLLGVLAAAFAMVALVVAPRARLLSTLIAVWLFVSAIVLADISTATLWNNIIVAIAMFVLSLVPSTLPASARVGSLAPRRG